MTTNKLSIDLINKRIKSEICYETIDKLKDINLINEYKDYKSVKNKVNKLKSILEKHKIKNEIKNNILNEYFLDLIPAGTKGVIRGIKFNKIIKELINGINLDKTKFEICFEKKCSIETSEIPDWYILDKVSGKILIGMNQLDLWKGGQQLNRGSKYLIDNKLNTKNSKILCVVCNEIIFSKDTNKIYKLFEIGFTNNTLCYIKNLPNIINSFFSL